MRLRLLMCGVAGLLAVAGCGSQQSSGAPNGVTSGSHTWFPIASGIHAVGAATSDGAMACASCHPSNTTSFKQFNCVGCHDHEQGITDRLHVSVKDYGYTSPQCLSCHPSGEKVPFDHSGITGMCAQCHDLGTPFAALPVPGFTHQPTNGADCGSCHNTSDWKTAAGAPGGNSHDPMTDIDVNALIPTYSGTSIAKLTPKTEQLSMSMNHASGDLAPATLSACVNCHPSSSSGGYYPGNLHGSLATLAKSDPTVNEPKACASCHSDAVPVGFVGPTATTPARNPGSGEMKHDAVVWTNGKPTTTLLVSTKCETCHASPSGGSNVTWATGTSGGAVAYHPALDAAKMPQPSSCIDCHANSQPNAVTNSTTPSSASTGSSTGIAAGTMAQISHADVNVTAHDCNFCHTQPGPSTKAGIQGKEWAQAKFHANLTSTANPLVLNTSTGRCSNCHMADKPGPAFTAQDHSAFTNAAGSEDCSSCHTFPGTGTVSAPNWLGAAGMPQNITVGGFPISQPPATTTTTQTGISNLPHPAVPTGTSCTSCHTSAGGGKDAIGYDHKSTLINANCNACHEAGSNLVGTKWNGATSQGAGAGDTRPFTIVGLVPSFKGNSRALTNGYNHFFAVDCHECHLVPAGNGLTTTGSAYKTAWRFDHNEGRMKGSTCNMCHGSPNNLPGD